MLTQGQKLQIVLPVSCDSILCVTWQQMMSSFVVLFFFTLNSLLRSAFSTHCTSRKPVDKPMKFIMWLWCVSTHLIDRADALRSQIISHKTRVQKKLKCRVLNEKPEDDQIYFCLSWREHTASARTRLPCVNSYMESFHRTLLNDVKN